MISKLHYITQGETVKQQLEYIQKACDSGADWVQLRMKNFDDIDVLKTAEKARQITADFKTKLIINDYYKIAKAVEADGVHLGKQDADPVKVRHFLGAFYYIGGTANTLEDCKQLVTKNVDYIGLGPYQFTTTKSKLSPLLGLEGYHTIIKNLQTQIPIIAIGGISVNDVSALLDSGVYGVAVSGTITKNFKNIQTLYGILNEPLATQKQ